MANNWRKLKFLTKVKSLNIKLVENEKGRWLHVLALLCLYYYYYYYLLEDISSTELLCKFECK